MTAVRALGAIYLATASVFGVAIALHQHPAWNDAAGRAATALGEFADNQLVRPVSEAGHRQVVALFDSIDPPARPLSAPRYRAVAQAAREKQEKREARLERRAELDLLARRHPAEEFVPPSVSPSSNPDVAPLALRPIISEDDNTASKPEVESPSPPDRLALEQSQSPAPPKVLPNAEPSPASPLPPAELTRVVARLKQNLTPQLFENFELFLYVSKADAGPWAQHMYVFNKTADGGLDLRYNWPVSTGREKLELNDAGLRLSTHTPQGYYQLDPQRLYRHYTSSEWGQSMPYAMFFNWIRGGEQTGLAIHAATGDDVAMLGKRASAGCIRLSPANASTLFGLIRSHYRGLAPRFAYDRRTGTMSNEGILLHDAGGHVRLAEGYKVLVFIENYGGDENVVAALF
jgi:lipoprotein-anchoring transpeptidase ErfK/SrfK